jgi:hypothetical protein
MISSMARWKLTSFVGAPPLLKHALVDDFPIQAKCPIEISHSGKTRYCVKQHTWMTTAFQSGCLNGKLYHLNAEVLVQHHFCSAQSSP